MVLVLPSGEVKKQNWTSPIPLVLAEGGATRPESVSNGLKAASCDYVMVHDAARPFVDRDILARLMEATSEDCGAIPVMPLSEAVKRIEGEKVMTVNREGLYGTQTPQCFARRPLMQALQEYGAEAKDEAEAWISSCRELRPVRGKRTNFKVTWPEDFELARAVAERGAKVTRTGIGYDVHPLVPERPLILGGVEVPKSPLGLLGHSDADLLAHTVSDALLGAAGLPDIGNLFPASDETYRGADSMELLAEVVRKITEEGWTIVWIDSVIQAQVPRLNAFVPLMKERLVSVLGSPQVNVKVKSAEGIGDEGAGRAMTCWAVATLALQEDLR